MASEDNVVRIKHLATCACAIAGLSSHTCLSHNADNALRLKHLQTFANSLDCDISFNNPDNAAKLKHLTALASALASNSSSITISSFSIEPSNLSIVLGDEPVTASASVITDPADCDYQLSIPDAPDWISIDNNIISFAPTSDTTPDTYSFTVVASASFDGITSNATQTITLTVKPARISPNLKITEVAPGYSTIVSGNASVDAYNYALKEIKGYTGINAPYFIRATFKGPKDTRKIKFGGTFANSTNKTLNSTSSSLKISSSSISSVSVGLDIEFNGTVTSASKGTSTGIATLSISADDTYTAQSKTVRFLYGKSTFDLKTVTK